MQIALARLKVPHVTVVPAEVVDVAAGRWRRRRIPRKQAYRLEDLPEYEKDWLNVPLRRGGILGFIARIQARWFSKRDMIGFPPPIYRRDQDQK